MTLKNDSRNKSERIYTKKFESIAAEYGISINYDSDRAALDLGLHLTVPEDTRFEGVTETRVWFQFKSFNVNSLSIEAFDRSDNISLNVEIDHLRQWYRYAEPVYLAVYIQAVDKFFAVDIKKVIDERWGDSLFKDETFREVKGRRQETIIIKIPKTAEVNEAFWKQLGAHRSMRIDGASYQGNPLPHPYDFRLRVPQKMDPALYTELVNDLLRAHDYRIKTAQDGLQLYPDGSASGDVVTLTTGVMYDPYEIVPYLTTTMIPDEDGFRADGQTFKIQGPCAVLIHSQVKSRPGIQLLEDLVKFLEEQHIKHLLVFINHYMFFDKGLTGETPYNCFPEFSQVVSESIDFCPPQHLEDLGRKILLSVNIYMAYRERLRWIGETISRKIETGELRLMTADELGFDGP